MIDNSAVNFSCRVWQQVGAPTNMSDWEDEYDEQGVAICKPAAKSAPVEWERPSDTAQQQSAYFGVRSRGRFGADRNGDDRRRGGNVSISVRGHSRDSSPGSFHVKDRGGSGRQRFSNGKSDSSPPVTIAVGNALVGRIIGWLLRQ